jgi:hypothetical protein
MKQYVLPSLFNTFWINRSCPMCKLSTLIISVGLFFMPQNGYAQNCAANAGLDQVICVNQSLNLSGQVFQPQSNPVYIRWKQVSGPNTATISNAAATGTAVTNLIPGQYIFELANACTIDTARDRVAITVLQQTPTALVGRDTQVCSLTAVNLSGNTPPTGVTGTWTSTPSSGTFSNANSPTSTFTPTVNSTIYTLTWTLSNGACSTTANMMVRAVGATTPVSAGADITVSCDGTSTVLNGSNPGVMPPQSVLWTYVSGPATPVFSSRIVRNPTISGLVVGTYEFKYEVSGPCASGSDNVVVTVSDILVPPNSGNNKSYTSYCSVNPVTTEVLSGAPLLLGETAKWTQVTGTGATFSPNDYESSVTAGNLLAPSKSWSFRYTKTGANGCVTFSTHNVFRVDSLMSLTVPSSISPACNTNAIFDVSWTGASSTVNEDMTRAVTFVSGPVTPTGSPSRSGLSTYSDRWTISNLTTPGTYVYLVTYSNQCGSQSRYITINNSRTPGAVNAGSSIIVPCAQNFTYPTGFAATPGALSWTQVSGPNTATLTNVNTSVLTMSNLASGRYMMRLTNSGGSNCPAKSDTMLVIVPQQPTTTVVLGPDDTVCAGRHRLNGSRPAPGERGTWTVSPSSGITFSPNNTNPRAYAVGLAVNTVYTFTWTISGACGNKSDQQVITTSATAAPPVPSAGSDQCISSSATLANLSGSSPGTATPQWTALTSGATLSSSNTQNTTATISGGTGVYAFRYQLSIAGCDAFDDTVLLSINHNVTSVNAGADQQVCGLSLPTAVTLTANIAAPTGANSLWSQVSGPGSATIATPSATSTQLSGLGIGVYEMMYSITTGTCTSVRDTMSVIINAPPTTSNAGSDQSLCGGGTGGTGSAVLAANTPTSGSGIWSLASGPGSVTFSSVSSPTATVSGLIYGNYYLVWNITPSGGAGICNTSTDTMVIRVVPAAYAGEDAIYCNVSNVQLSGNTGTSGTWSFISGSSTPSISANSSFTAIASGLDHATLGSVYVFRYTLPVIGSCSSTFDEVTITNYSKPSQADAGNDIEICHNASSATLSAVLPTAGVGYWQYISGPGTPSAGTGNGTFTDSVIQNLAAGVHTFRFYVYTHPTACLVSTDDVMVIRERPANAGNDTAACSPDSIFLNGGLSAFNNTTWSYISGPGAPVFSDVTNPKSRIKSLQPGTYVLRYTLDGPVGCASNTDDVQITIDEKITGLQAGRDTLIWVNNTLNLGSSTALSGVTYQWSPGTFLNSTTVSNPVFTIGYSPGSYVYTVTGSRGVCRASDQVYVTVQGSKISGTIRHDLDGNRNNDVDGVGWSKSPSIEVFLLENGYIIKKTTADATTGVYLFDDVNTQTDYSIFVQDVGSNYNIGDRPPSVITGMGYYIGITGEEYGLNNLAGTGLESGKANGVIAVKSGNAFVTDVDFGVNMLPKANFVFSSNNINKGGTNTNASPPLTGSDEEDGPLSGASPFSDTLVILMLPTNATLYYDNVAVVKDQAIPNFDNSKLTVDPHFNGSTSFVYFQYGWKDDLGQSSSVSSASYALLFYRSITAIFNVLADGDALLDGVIDGNPILSVTGQPINAYLVDENTGLVAQRTYGVYPNNPLVFYQLNGYYNYRIQLSTDDSAVGSLPPSGFNLPANWQATGEQYGTNNAAGTGIESGVPNGSILLQTAETDITGITFGINHTTMAHRKKYLVDPNAVTGLTGRPRGSFTHWLPLYHASGNFDTAFVATGTGAMPGRLSGYDVEDGRIRGLTGRSTSKVVLRSLPDTGNALLQYEVEGQVYHLTPNPTVQDPAYSLWNSTYGGYQLDNFNPDNLKLLVKMAYQDSTSFEYAYIDNTNTLGSFSLYTVGYITPLPVSFQMKNCTQTGQSGLLQWRTFGEEGYQHFNVMRSIGSQNGFAKIGEVAAHGYSVLPVDYSFKDDNRLDAEVYYRIDIVKHDNTVLKAGYCHTMSAPDSDNTAFCTAYPNPANHFITVDLMNDDDGIVQIAFKNAIGQEVIQMQHYHANGKSSLNIDVSGLIPGLYFFECRKEGEVFRQRIIKQ